MAVEFKEDGSVGFVFPFMASSEKLIDGANAAAKATKFKPAVLNGRPVTVVMIIDYSFAR